MLKSNTVLLALTLTLFGCGPSPVDKKIESFSQLKTKIESGDLAWVEENSKDIMSLSIKGAKPDSSYLKPSESDGWGDDWRTIMRYRWSFAEDIALVYLASGDELVANSALRALKHFPTFYDEDSRYPNSNKQLISRDGVFNNFHKLSLLDQIEIFTALANENPNVTYDLDDSNFLRDELCRAVGVDKIGYVAMLIARANFDIGLVRCYDTGGSRWDKYAAYNGNQSCPMSLRRVSGINAGAKMNARNNQFLRNLKNSNFEDMDNDVKKIKTAFYKSFDNLPDLSNVSSMNDLLDKYNKWDAGGDCTTRNLLKPGVSLPKGW
jgi:hypothetical protein